MDWCDRLQCYKTRSPAHYIYKRVFINLSAQFTSLIWKLFYFKKSFQTTRIPIIRNWVSISIVYHINVRLSYFLKSIGTIMTTRCALCCICVSNNDTVLNFQLRVRNVYRTDSMFRMSRSISKIYITQMGPLSLI